MRHQLRLLLSALLMSALPGLLLLLFAQGFSSAVPVSRLPHKNYVEKIPDSKVTFTMVAIPGGTFRLGSPETEKGRQADEGPQRAVEIRPFWMGKCEVTWDEYDCYRKLNGKLGTSNRDNDAALAKEVDAVTRPTQTYPDAYRDLGKEGYPAIGMSHHAAREYCYWLSKKTGKAYRLPTEAEWEYACRAGTKSAYSFGAEANKLGEYAWYSKNADDKTHPVGQKKPNPWGLHDMHGNVMEWCLDYYEKDRYRAYRADRLTLQPVNLPGAERYPHVARGGSFEDRAERCRSAARRPSDRSWNRIDPDVPQSIWWVWNADFVGFRIVRAVEEQANLQGIRSKVTRKSP